MQTYSNSGMPVVYTQVGYTEGPIDAGPRCVVNVEVPSVFALVHLDGSTAWRTITIRDSFGSVLVDDTANRPIHRALAHPVLTQDMAEGRVAHPNAYSCVDWYPCEK